MGFFDKKQDSHNISAGRDVINSPIIHGDIHMSVDNNGPSCPFDWNISYGTCGICPKSNGCKEWYALKKRALDDMSGY